MKIVILGSTGNLGLQTLEILEEFKELEVIALSGNQNAELLEDQASRLKAEAVLTSETGPEALVKLATLPEADIVINVLSGLAGTAPTIAALKAGKTLLTANKESIVTAGEEIISLAQPGQLIPLDSEHNAIYEILSYLTDSKNIDAPQISYRYENISRIILPCSGGPFNGLEAKQLATKTVQDALKHPRWNMGAKISLESALLINKGLEIIEAHYLFQMPLEKIEVRIHPQCQIHGIVQTSDGEHYAYISPPDMKEPIENALLRALGKTPQRTIRKIAPEEIPPQTPNHQLLPGIEIVKRNFQKGALKEFLQQEERGLKKAQDNPDMLVQNLISLLQSEV